MTVAHEIREVLKTVKNPSSLIRRGLEGTIQTMGSIMDRFKKKYRGTEYDLDYSYFINVLRKLYSSGGRCGDVYGLLDSELHRVNPGLPYRIEGYWEIKYIG